MQPKISTSALDHRDRLQWATATWDPLPFDADSARMYGRVFAAARAAGQSCRARLADLLIASTAAANGLPVYTRNPSDFAALKAHPQGRQGLVARSAGSLKGFRLEGFSERGNPGIMTGSSRANCGHSADRRAFSEADAPTWDTRGSDCPLWHCYPKLGTALIHVSVQ